MLKRFKQILEEAKLKFNWIEIDDIKPDKTYVFFLSKQTRPEEAFKYHINGKYWHVGIIQDNKVYETFAEKKFKVSDFDKNNRMYIDADFIEVHTKIPVKKLMDIGKKGLPCDNYVNEVFGFEKTTRKDLVSVNFPWVGKPKDKEPKLNPIITPEIDKEYMELIKTGNMDEIQKMVNKYALEFKDYEKKRVDIDFEKFSKKEVPFEAYFNDKKIKILGPTVRFPPYDKLKAKETVDDWLQLMAEFPDGKRSIVIASTLRDEKGDPIIQISRYLPNKVYDDQTFFGRSIPHPPIIYDKDGNIVPLSQRFMVQLTY